MNPGADPDPEHLRRINALLEVALALREDEREAWLTTLPPEQQALVPLLSRMLSRAAVETDSFMRRPLSFAAQDLGELDGAPDRTGDLIGPYRLLRELGQGGMATVWLAERSDGTLQRQVALKLPRTGWALGLARRMARERDILATLEHPRIARLYDAGVSETGRPWLAMECVSGVPIDVFCREQGLDVPQRLRLFLQVADAVAHAHARLIVHRDLKPSNILVTAGGEVRLLDFGVAKLLEDETAPAANLTQQIGRAITPDYASPEQIAGRAVTVATDVYSLGVVLYELLTGERPYRLARQSAAALEEAILSLDVPLASARMPGERKLARRLRGDIDTVLAKALRKDAAQRYPSVESMAADIERHLGGLPVLARPDSALYRASRFVSRHRGAVASACLVFAAVLAGLAGTMSQASRADRLARQAQQDRDAALRELKFAEAAAAFMRFVLSESPNKPFTTAELLDRADQAVDAEYANDAELRARLQLVVAELFNEQRDFKRALAVLERARASAQAAGGNALRAAIECRRAGVLGETAETAHAEQLFSAAMAELQATAVSASQVDALITCHAERSDFNARRARLQAAIDDANEALRLIGEPRPTHAAAVNTLRVSIANARSELGQVTTAVELLDRELDEASRLGRSGSTMALRIANNLGVTLGRAGQPQRAALAYERGLARARQSGGHEDHALTISYSRLLVDLGRADEALPLLERATAQSERADDALFHALGVFGLAAAHCERREWARCGPLLDEARKRLRPVIPADRAFWGTFEVVAARASIARADLAGAREQLRGAIALYDAAIDRSSGRARALSLLARVQAELGDAAAAQADAARALQAARAATDDFPRSAWIGEALLAQAAAQRAQGDLAAARASVHQALEHLRASAGARAPYTQEAEALARALGT